MTANRTQTTATAFTVFALALLGLSGCQRAAEPKQATTTAPKAVAAGASQQTPSRPPARCAPAPTLAQSDDFADPRDEFGEDSQPFMRLVANFGAAYVKACEEGIMKGQRLVPPGTPHPDTLFLVNAPDSNIASIYRESEEQAQPGDMALEYYFLTSDGKRHVPSVNDLHEAIYCAVVGATQQEEEASGRCLPD